eukprot:scaffold18904_cov112-Isochrysis_galbana.AAC.1
MRSWLRGIEGPFRGGAVGWGGRSSLDAHPFSLSGCVWAPGCRVGEVTSLPRAVVVSTVDWLSVGWSLVAIHARCGKGNRHACHQHMPCRFLP